MLESFDLTKMHGLRTRSALCEVLFSTGIAHLRGAVLEIRNDIRCGNQRGPGHERQKRRPANGALHGPQPCVAEKISRRANGRGTLPLHGGQGQDAAGHGPLLSTGAYEEACGSRKHIKNHIFPENRFVTHMIEKREPTWRW